MDIDSLYLALSEENLEDVILPEKRAERDKLRSKDSTDNFTANATDNFFPRICCQIHKKHDKREPGLFKEEFRCAEMLCLCSKTYVVMINILISTSLAAKDSTKEHWKTVAMVDQCQSIAKCWRNLLM